VLLPTFPRDRSIDIKKHMEKFLSLCEIHFIEHDNAMLQLVLQKLTKET